MKCTSYLSFNRMKCLDHMPQELMVKLTQMISQWESAAKADRKRKAGDAGETAPEDSAAADGS